MTAQTPHNSSAEDDANSGGKRRYNSPVRRQQSAATRQRIVSAGAELAHESPTWDWQNLTFRAVSERAGVSERTVYRYFATEKLLKDAVIEQMTSDSGISFDELSLDNFAEQAALTFDTLATFAAANQTPSHGPETLDASFESIDSQRKDALRRAVASAAPGWTASEQADIAAVMDLLWHPATYERLARGWGMEPRRASRTLTWLYQLVREAVNEDRRPQPPTGTD